MTDKRYMERALALAEKGVGWTSPNPMVGAVIVKEGRIIGEGYHARYGALHAERMALQACQESPEGATMFVTLEPCSHYGKQPPCVDAIIEAKIAKVVVGAPDPNPLVSGRGVKILRAHGIEVTEGVLREACERLNEVFMHYITCKTPFVVMKTAMTLDGKIACYTGASRWVTGEMARNEVQMLRHRYAAIMVGVGTVLRDNPRLTCRMEGGKTPLRVICDSRLRTPLDAYVVETAPEVPTVIAIASNDEEKRCRFLAAGGRVVVLAGADGRVNLEILMEWLGREGIDSVLLEGGGSLNWAALQAGVVHKVVSYVAPKFFGGSEAKTPVEGQGVATPLEAVSLKIQAVRQVGEDVCIESEVVGCSQALLKKSVTS